MLNEAEKDHLQRVVDDEALLAILRKIFDGVADLTLPGDQGANLELGEKYRAFLHARRIIAGAFFELESYKKTSLGQGKLNRSR